MEELASERPQIQQFVCQNHNCEIILVDINSSENGQIQYLCLQCLVERRDNNNLLTLKQAKDLTQQLKDQRQKNQQQKIETKLNQYENLRKQVIQFKKDIGEDSQKIISQITEQILKIQDEQRNSTIQDNFQEDVRSLSEFLFQDTQENQMELQQDGQFIDKIFEQFKLISNNATYSKTIDTFMEAQLKIKEIYQVQLTAQQPKNAQKTPSLNKNCPTHKKEIVMIDIDSNNRSIEDRFFCIDCISEHPECQHKTIEQVNEKWNQAIKKQNQSINELQLKSQKKWEKLTDKVAKMRNNYNSELNKISKQLITQYSLPGSKTSEMKKLKQISIQQLSNNQLLSSIKFLIQQDQGELIQDSNFERIKSMDSSFYNEIKIKLENLQQHDSLDIQELINDSQDNENPIKGIHLFSQQIQENSRRNQEQLFIKQELEELIISSRQIYCQLYLFNQTIQKYQEHLKKINNLKMKTIPDQMHLKSLQKEIQDYSDKFENDFNQCKKFCGIGKLEIKVRQLNKLKIQNNKLIIELKKEVEQQNIVKNEIQKDLDYRKQLVDPILNLKPQLLQDKYWIKLFFILQEKSKKTIKELQLIFQGTRDGLNGNSFWSKCNGKSNLLLIFQSQNGNIFGGFSPCTWQQNINNYVQDDTLSSFIFSQTHDQIYPLRQDRKQYALYCNSGYGPSLGGGYDIHINPDFKDCYSNLGHSYQWDNYQNQKSTHLFGQDKPDLSECEIYELKYI